MLKRARLLLLALCALAGAARADAPAVDAARLLDDVRTLASREFGGRRTGSEGGRKTQAWLQARFAALGLKPYGAGYARPFSFIFRSEQLAAANVVGYLEGTQTPERMLLVSAHFDHLGERDGKLYPGADDNASGVAAMLAIAAWFKAHPPQHTIVFAAFDGEEQGLRGAQAFAAALPFPRRQLALNLNLDMVSHNDANEIFAAGTGATPALKALVQQVAARSTVQVRLGHDRRSSEDWTDSSDHGAFHAMGVPFLYFGVEEHADYHAPTDTFEHINQGFFVKVAQLLVDMAATLDRQDWGHPLAS